MKGFVDLHCHWLPGIDDGARTLEEGAEMLRRLHRAGFSHVVATPHIRPAMFENRAPDLLRRFIEILPLLRELPDQAELPEVSLSSEHFYDDLVFDELRAGRGLPFRLGTDFARTDGRTDARTDGQTDGRTDARVGGTLLIEFHDLPGPGALERRLGELTSRGYLPLIAHPERYRELWRDPARLESALEAGAVALLDVAAVLGKYGAEPRRTAERLLELGLYEAACSDAHRPSDVDDAAAGIDWLFAQRGAEEARFLLDEAPRSLLHDSVPA